MGIPLVVVMMAKLPFSLQLLKCIPNLTPARAITYTNVFSMYFFCRCNREPGLAWIMRNVLEWLEVEVILVSVQKSVFEI